jgi:predicted transcriptional regulator of viral defense system
MTSSVDNVIDAIAAGQRGLVTRPQLRQHGISADVIDRRLRGGRLRPLHRGVYQVGPVAAPYARELAAVLACGPHSFVSHRSAGALWQLLPGSAEATAVDVSITQGDRGHRPNIRVHRVFLAADEVTWLHGIPVTSASRTLMDLAAVLARRELERALAQRND